MQWIRTNNCSADTNWRLHSRHQSNPPFLTILLLASDIPPHLLVSHTQSTTHPTFNYHILLAIPSLLRHPFSPSTEPMMQPPLCLSTSIGWAALGFHNQKHRFKKTTEKGKCPLNHGMIEEKGLKNGHHPERIQAWYRSRSARYPNKSMTWRMHLDFANNSGRSQILSGINIAYLYIDSLILCIAPGGTSWWKY